MKLGWYVENSNDYCQTFANESILDIELLMKSWYTVKKINQKNS